MKVLHINTNYTYTTLHQLMIDTLDQIGGIENHVFSAVYDKGLGVITPNPNVCVCECFRKWDRLFFDYKQNKIRKAVESHYQLANYDLIHAYTLFTDGNCARKLSQKYGIPYVVAVRNTDVNAFFRLRPHLRRRGVKIMQDAAAVFFLSDSYRSQIFERYIPKMYHDEISKKVRIIPNGIDEFWFDNTPMCEKKLDHSVVKLIYAGSIDRNKNISTTQKAMELLRSQGIETRLTVVGRIQEQRAFEIIAKDQHTSFLPAVPKDELLYAYREADIFVMPSHRESFGLVYAEAMSQGLPVVYTRGQGFDRQFPEGAVGYAVDSRSPESVADGIRKVIEHYPQLSAKCVSSARKFRWSSFSKEYAAVYHEIVGGGSTHA